MGISNNSKGVVEQFKKATEDAKKELPASKHQKKVLELLAWITFVVALIPAIFVLVGVTYEVIRKLSKKSIGIEVNGEKVSSVDYHEAAKEGLAQRAKKAAQVEREKKEAEFAQFMKSYEQGKKSNGVELHK